MRNHTPDTTPTNERNVGGDAQVDRPNASDSIGFYVTVRDANRHGYLLGPYATHDEALADVDRGSRLACEADPKAHFYAFGTAKVTAPKLPRSVFGVSADATAHTVKP